jgi:hypothetical protein
VGAQVGVESPSAYLAGLVIDGSVVGERAKDLSRSLSGARCLLKAAAAPRATKVLGKHGASALPPARRVFAHHGRTYCLLFKFSAIRKYLPSFYGSCLLACLPSVSARFIYKKYWAHSAAPGCCLPAALPQPTHTLCVHASVPLACVCVCASKHSLDWEKR